MHLGLSTAPQLAAGPPGTGLSFTVLLCFALAFAAALSLGSLCFFDAQGCSLKHSSATARGGAFSSRRAGGCSVTGRVLCHLWSAFSRRPPTHTLVPAWPLPAPTLASPSAPTPCMRLQSSSSALPTAMMGPPSSWLRSCGGLPS